MPLRRTPCLADWREGRGVLALGRHPQGSPSDNDHLYWLTRTLFPLSCPKFQRMAQILAIRIRRDL